MKGYNFVPGTSLACEGHINAYLAQEVFKVGTIIPETGGVLMDYSSPIPILTPDGKRQLPEPYVQMDSTLVRIIEAIRPRGMQGNFSFQPRRSYRATVVDVSRKIDGYYVEEMSDAASLVLALAIAVVKVCLAQEIMVAKPPKANALDPSTMTFSIDEAQIITAEGSNESGWTVTTPYTNPYRRG